MQCAIYGNFSSPKAQEIAVSRGKVLELLRPDDAGKVQTIFTTEVFGCIRCLAPFRLTGASRYGFPPSSPVMQNLCGLFATPCRVNELLPFHG